jgi:hypothetical protein
MNSLTSYRESSSLERRPFLFTGPIRAITNRVYAVVVFLFTTLFIAFYPKKRRVGFSASVIVNTFTKAEPAMTCALTDERGRVVVPLDDSKGHAAMEGPTEGFDPTEMFIDTDEICAILLATGMPPRILGFFQYHLDKHLQALAREVASGAITPKAAMERLCTIFGPEETSEIILRAREEHKEDLSTRETASPGARRRIRKQLQDISNLAVVMPPRTMGREGRSIKVVHTELTYGETQTLQRWLPGFLASQRVQDAIFAYFNDHLPV